MAKFHNSKNIVQNLQQHGCSCHGAVTSAVDATINNLVQLTSNTIKKTFFPEPVCKRLRTGPAKAYYIVMPAYTKVEKEMSNKLI